MSGFLLDPNVVSELTKNTPAPHVIAFLRNQDDIGISTVAAHELGFRLNILCLRQQTGPIR